MTLKRSVERCRRRSQPEAVERRNSSFSHLCSCFIMYEISRLSHCLPFTQATQAHFTPVYNGNEYLILIPVLALCRHSRLTLDATSLAYQSSDSETRNYSRCKIFFGRLRPRVAAARLNYCGLQRKKLFDFSSKGRMNNEAKL